MQLVRKAPLLRSAGLPCPMRFGGEKKTARTLLQSSGLLNATDICEAVSKGG